MTTVTDVAGLFGAMEVAHDDAELATTSPQTPAPADQLIPSGGNQ
jgi:hypothetical protein